ncbi:hypothetical protein H0H81_012266 [Sphagnurus paluster]|uniref:Copper transport protein n=1 Tax=Sphagnurus paluster TaxID=117069 RepID=A0A9P7GP14_9AGAR|nr:hypothetical protein H0H81_012266 [Sphagnurus paluster]
MGDMSMVPFFHWAGGDYLLFQAWSPTSPGAIAGASLGLVCLALFDRWLAATRGALDNHWRQKGLAMASRPLNYSGKSSPSPTNETSDKSSLNADSADDSNPLAPLTNRRGTVTLTRTVPPFIWAHDLPRGLLHAGQSLLSQDDGVGNKPGKVYTFPPPTTTAMFFSLFTALALITSVQAHFRLLYPAPRGEFVADNEPNFCGGYTEAVSNRTTFPLSGGFFTIKSGHGDWTAGAIISTIQNPISFDNFSVSGNQQIVSPYAHEENAGTFCIPLNLTASGITDVKDGANVTIQIVYSGGDGNLYQCADLTLSSNLTAPQDATCKNETTESHHGGSETTSGSAAPAQTGAALGSAHAFAGYSAVVLGFTGVAALLL